MIFEPHRFGKIRANIADFGSRVGEGRPLGNHGTDTVLGGYLVINADDLDAAITVAKGCPGLQQGGGVEVGAIVDQS